MDAQTALVLSAAIHGGVLLGSFQAMPALDETWVDAARIEGTFLIHPYLDAPAEPEEGPPPPASAGEAGDDRARADSRCGDDRGGSMGEPRALDADRRYGVQGPADNPDPHVARDGSFEDAYEFDTPPGDAGGALADPAGPFAPWGRDDSLGTDPRSARAHLWGEEIGIAFGSPGTGVGLLWICPTCGAFGRGARRSFDPLGALEGGATGTARSGG